MAFRKMLLLSPLCFLLIPQCQSVKQPAFLRLSEMKRVQELSFPYNNFVGLRDSVPSAIKGLPANQTGYWYGEVVIDSVVTPFVVTANPINRPSKDLSNLSQALKHPKPPCSPVEHKVLIIDKNRNNDFADETPSDSRVLMDSVFFGGRRDPKSQTFSDSFEVRGSMVSLVFSVAPCEQGLHILMRRTDALRGNVSIGGKKYGILIWDREMGGYSNESNISIAVDANQDGRFNTAAGSDETYHFFGKPVIFRGTQFYLKGISSDHTKLMVTDMAQTTLTHNNASVGGTVQEFTAKDRDGKLFSLSESLKSNDYAILVFFFSACGGCADLNSKLQLPPQEVLRHFLNKYCGKTTIVGIEAAGDTAARLDSATTISSSTRKHVNDSTTEWDLNSIPLVNNVSGFPCMLIVDKKRRIVYRGYECSVDWILRDLWTNIGRTDYQKVLTELSDMNKAQAHN